MPQKCAGTRIEPPPSLPTPPAEKYCRDRGRFTSARSAGCAIEIPWVVRSAGDVVVALPDRKKFRAVRFAQDNAARRRESSSNHSRVGAGAMIQTETAAAQRRQITNVEAVLDCDRDAVQGASARSSLGLPRGRSCFRRELHHEGVDCWVMLLDLFQMSVDQFRQARASVDESAAPSW